MEAIEDCLGIQLSPSQLNSYKFCVKDRRYLDDVYNSVNYFGITSYSNLESLLFINNTRNMKAYMNYKFFLYDSIG